SPFRPDRSTDRSPFDHCPSGRRKVERARGRPAFPDPRQTMSVRACRLIDLPRIKDPRGNLTFVEGLRHVPFDLRRVYYLYDVPGGSDRGGHAHRNLEQFLIAMSGSFDIVLDDGSEKVHYHLNRSY